MTVETLTGLGVRKAAIVLIQLGREKAGTVMSHLSENEVELLSQEIARLQSISASETEQVLSEFRELVQVRANISQGGLAFAQGLLEESLGPDRAAALLAAGAGFDGD